MLQRPLSANEIIGRQREVENVGLLRPARLSPRPRYDPDGQCMRG